MKKTLIAIAIIGLASTAVAGWPEGYQGDQLPDGCFGIEAEIVDWLDRNPWGQVSPVGVVAAGDLCVEGEVATLNIKYIVNRRCEDGAPPVCEYRVTVPFQEPIRVLPFVQGAYIAYVHNDNSTAPYEALVWDLEADEGLFIDGVFDFVTPLWFYESDEYTRLVWKVSPRSEELIFPRARKGARPRR
jgi:hypothetical protein